MKKISSFFVFFILLFTLSCSVFETAEKGNVTLRFGGSRAAMPSEVTRITVTVTGDDMAQMGPLDVNMGTLELNLSVSPGSARKFTALAYNSSGQLIYQGSATMNISSDGENAVSIGMQPVTAEAAATYTLTINSSNAVYGSVSGAGSFTEGSVRSITATPAAGYKFDSWSGGTVANSTSASTTITMPASAVTLTANFSVDTGQTFALTINSNNINYGTVTGAGNYNAEHVQSITATAATGYKFDSWTGGTVANSTSASTTITMPGSAVTLTANFSVDVSQTFALTVNANTGGTASGGGSYNVGASPTLIVTPDSGYMFTHWSGDIDILSNAYVSSPVVVMKATSKTITANFIPFVNGSITVSDFSMDFGRGAGYYYDYWSFTATQNETVSIELYSSYDNWLYLYTGNTPAGGGTQIASNDDYNNLNAKIVYSVTSGTTYYIVTTTYNSGNTGAYQLAVNGSSSGAISVTVDGSGD